MNRGQLDQDYERLVRDGVHRETRYIYAHSDEEVHLLRYLLNVNSTKMRRSVAVEEPSSWQSKDTTWIITFISPVYSDWITANSNRNSFAKLCSNFNVSDFTSPIANRVHFASSQNSRLKCVLAVVMHFTVLPPAKRITGLTMEEFHTVYPSPKTTAIAVPSPFLSCVKQSNKHGRHPRCESPL